MRLARVKAGVFEWGVLLEKNEKWRPQELVLVLDGRSACGTGCGLVPKTQYCFSVDFSGL